MITTARCSRDITQDFPKKNAELVEKKIDCEIVEEKKMD